MEPVWSLAGLPGILIQVGGLSSLPLSRVRLLKGRCPGRTGPWRLPVCLLLSSQPGLRSVTVLSPSARAPGSAALSGYTNGGQNSSICSSSLPIWKMRRSNCADGVCHLLGPFLS